MTATRWWVRAAARWMARIDGVKGHLSLMFQAMTGVSLASGVLKYFGLTQFVVPFLLVTAAATMTFAYYFAEGGVWNQVSRDRVDLSDNYAGPTMRMDNEFMARAIHAAEEGRPLQADEREAIKRELDETFREYRDGIQLEDLA